MAFGLVSGTVLLLWIGAILSTYLAIKYSFKYYLLQIKPNILLIGLWIISIVCWSFILGKWLKEYFQSNPDTLFMVMIVIMLVIVFYPDNKKAKVTKKRSSRKLK